MIKFILNNQDVAVDLPPGMLLLDFLRYHKALTGTKIGCREGDCGACTVLVGTIEKGSLQYLSFTSCLTPLGNVHGRHVITVEGLNMDALNCVQQAICDASGTQCGFCTPGFVVSLTGFCLSGKSPSTENAIAAIDGNICRCTGYKSLERAAAAVALRMQENTGGDPLNFVTENGLLPSYLQTIGPRLQQLAISLNGHLHPLTSDAQLLGGGTDLYVQKHDELKYAGIHFLARNKEWNYITVEGNRCVLGASVTVSDLYESGLFRNLFPGLSRYLKLVSSTPIRNMATLAGNIVNASPIGDLTIFFLALNAGLTISDGNSCRELPLRELYKSYKKLALHPGEWIEKIWFELPGENTLFNFEKVSKRMHLDIASVNSAIRLSVKNNVVGYAHLSAGGVAPTPAYLTGTAEYLAGKEVTEELVIGAARRMQQEITPISDARGSEAYKRLLLTQLLKAHFITLFPFLKVDKLLHASAG